MLEDITNYFANFDGATNICRTIALWISVALVIGFVATKIYIAAIARKGKSDEATVAAANKLVNGSWIIIALIAAVGFIATFAGCYFAEVGSGEDYLFPILFYPLLVLMLAVVASGITLFVKPSKLAKIVCVAVCGCALIAVIVCMIVYHASGEAAENNYTDVLNSLGLYLSGGILAVGVIVFAFLSDRNSKPMDTRTITYAAVCVALSFALSYVRIFKMPMGGSITFASMLPLMLFAFMFGPRKGVLVGAIYGVLQAVQEPWIIHPAQFALDYLVAFAAIGLTGCMRTLGVMKGNMRAQFAVGAVIACGIRFVSHFFAGVFAFGVYAEGYAASYGMPALANPYFYSFVYQCLYIIPELAIVLAASMLIMASANFRKQIVLHSTYGGQTVAPQIATGDSENAASADQAAVNETGADTE